MIKNVRLALLALVLVVIGAIFLLQRTASSYQRERQNVKKEDRERKDSDATENGSQASAQDGTASSDVLAGLSIHAGHETSAKLLPQATETRSNSLKLETLPQLPTDALSTASPFQTRQAGTRTTSEPRKRMAIITFFSKDEGSQALKRLTFGNFEAYAARHGYDAIDALDNAFVAALFADHRTKFAVTHYFKFHVMKFFLPHYDWILWADGDSIFLNQSIRMEDLVDDNYDALFTINTREEPAWSLIINAGHYFLRNTPWTHRFLQECIYMSEHRCQEFLYLVPGGQPPVLNNWIHLCGADGGYWLSDQGVLQWLIMYKGQDYRCHMKFVGFRDFNSEFPWYEEGDFIVHFPGKSLETRQHLVPLFLRHVDPDTGLLRHDQLSAVELQDIAPVINPSNARAMYQQHYAPLNMPCVLYQAIVKPKLRESSTVIQSNVGPIVLDAIPAAFQLPSGPAAADPTGTSTSDVNVDVDPTKAVVPHPI